MKPLAKPGPQRDDRVTITRGPNAGARGTICTLFQNTPRVGVYLDAPDAEGRRFDSVLIENVEVVQS